ncbi:MAG TPA: hypothetical protein GX745_09205, partial [Clostridiales bacterium]|nr:hypothetical protein [Clostridiales bacterium]
TAFSIPLKDTSGTVLDLNPADVIEMIDGKYHLNDIELHDDSQDALRAIATKQGQTNLIGDQPFTFDVTELAMGTREKKYALLTDGDGNAVMPATEADNTLMFDGRTVEQGLQELREDIDKFANIDASKITSGTLSSDRIPPLSAEKITSGVFDAERIPHNKILYDDTHNFLSDEYFYTPDFEFEVGATYALELQFGTARSRETRIFTFTLGSAGFDYVDVSFVSLHDVDTSHARLATCLLRVYADRIRLVSAVGLSLYHDNNDIARYTPSYLRLRRVIKLR